MDDWQDHALSTRHMHNRNSRRASGKGKKNAAFDVRKTFGEYEVKCASWERALSAEDGIDEDASLELLRLTEDGQGVLGELVLPGVLRAAVVLAASRKTLTVITAELSGEGTEDSEDEDEEGAEDDDDDEEEEEEEEEEESSRFSTFEKNSFRSPKFWLAWNGSLTLPSPNNTTDSPPPSPSFSRSTKHHDSPPPSPTLHRTGSSFPPPKPSDTASTTAPAEGMGYVTFAGNECRKFKGTLSCSELGWRDVSFSGFKSVSRSESDRMVVWGGRDVDEGGWKGRGKRGDEEEEIGARLDARRRVVFDK